MNNFQKVVEKYRQYSLTSRDQGYKFEKLMKNFLETYQIYKGEVDHVWLWNDFPFKDQFSKGQDIGIDLIVKTKSDNYWAVQCKCFGEDTCIDKASVDSFLSTSARSFVNENNERINI